MGRERKSNPRKMRPQFLVLCEGETEEAYINFLKQRYRLPIKIVPRVVGNKISPRLIKQHKKGLSGVPDTIRTFLMYDGDLSNVVENLQQCEGTLLLSTPCLEIWFIAHFKKTGENEISSEECVKLLKELPDWENYKKAFLSIAQENALWENRMQAVANMESKTPGSANYSTVFEFIKILEEEKHQSS